MSHAVSQVIIYVFQQQHYNEGKGCPKTNHEGPEGEKTYSFTLSLISALDEVGGQGRAPDALPPGKARYLLYRKLDGPKGQCGGVRKFSPVLRFDPRTVQPVTSFGTDCAIPAHSTVIRYNNIQVFGKPPTYFGLLFITPRMIVYLYVVI
jgi:hypothetical protein